MFFTPNIDMFLPRSIIIVNVGTNNRKQRSAIWYTMIKRIQVIFMKSIILYTKMKMAILLCLIRKNCNNRFRKKKSKTLKKK